MWGNSGVEIFKNTYFFAQLFEICTFYGSEVKSTSPATALQYANIIIRANSISGRSEKYLIATKLERQALISVLFFFFVFQASRSELHVPLTIKDRSLFIARGSDK